MMLFGGVHPQGHVGVGDVVVDAGRDPDYRHPEAMEGLGALERTVAADDHQAVDLEIGEDSHRFFLPLGGAELF